MGLCGSGGGALEVSGELIDDVVSSSERCCEAVEPMKLSFLPGGGGGRLLDLEVLLGLSLPS